MEKEASGKKLFGKKYLPFLLAAAAGLAIGVGIGYQTAASHWETQVQELQWQLEMTENTAEQEATTQETMMVYVVGQVEHPGVVEVGKDARLYEAVEKAIPLAQADLQSLPMARFLVDGETIQVPAPGEVMTEAGKEAVAENGKVNINVASAQQLQERLPGIGEKLAQQIVQYREKYGSFATESDIMNVNGIGNSRYQDIADLITVK